MKYNLGWLAGLGVFIMLAETKKKKMLNLFAIENFRVKTYI